MRPKKLASLHPELINDLLKNHSLGVDDWAYQELAGVLHEWADRFNREFDLGLPTPAIRIDFIRARALGTYHLGRNGFGLRHEITLNARHLDRPLAEQLATLLHELIHEWQTLYGKNGRGSYHNWQFRQKALLYGLVVDARGCHSGVQPGTFTNLLAAHGVTPRLFEAAPDQPVFKLRLRGHSKMRKYRCGCTTARCATEFIVRCEKCGLRFE